MSAEAIFEILKNVLYSIFTGLFQFLGMDVESFPFPTQPEEATTVESK